jgi:hypothetical protein
MIAFDSMEKAQGWWTSPDYEAIKPIGTVPPSRGSISSRASRRSSLVNSISSPWGILPFHSAQHGSHSPQSKSAVANFDQS